jgi:hypothetical protein
MLFVLFLSMWIIRRSLRMTDETPQTLRAVSLTRNVHVRDCWRENDSSAVQLIPKPELESHDTCEEDCGL